MCVQSMRLTSAVPCRGCYSSTTPTSIRGPAIRSSSPCSTSPSRRTERGGGEGESEEDLDFLGLVMLWDPQRAEVPDAMAKAQAAGIRVVMITGDQAATAAAVGAAVGVAGGRTLVGSDIAAMSDEVLREAAKGASVPTHSFGTPNEWPAH